MLYRLSFKLQYLNAPRMDKMRQFLPDRLETYDYTADFYTARGRTRTASDEHDEQHHSL